MELEPQSEITQNILIQKKLNLSMKDFEILNIIGNGSQGDVYEATCSFFEQKIAIKAIKMPKSHFRAEKFMKRVQSQIIINTQIEKSSSIFLKFFPRFYGYFVENETFYLIFQLCSSNAFQLFKNLKTYQQRYIFSMVFFHDVIKSLHLLENKKILHRDIKPENVLFKENYFKLTDLGLAKDSFALKNLTIDVGNLFSKSPEIYQGKCDTKSDVWSLGITLYYLLENDLPYDEQTVKMMQGDKIEGFFERMRNKQFSININQRHQFKQKDFHIIDLYEILSRMIVVNVQKRSLASEINSEYFSEISIDSIDYQEVFRDIIFSQKPLHLPEIRQFLKYLLLKHLEHRSSELGMYFIILFSYIKQILKINKKMSKIKKMMENQDALKNKKKLIELQLLKSIKSSSFRLIQLLYKLITQESSQKGPDEITSFGQIQLSIQNKETTIHSDQKKLVKTIQLLLQQYEQFKHQFEQKQNILFQKQIQEQQIQKSVRFHNVLVCISQDNSQQQFKTVKLRQKQSSKVMSRKRIQATMNQVNQKLPKSMKYLNQNLENINIKQNEILSNFLKFYAKDKLNEKFLLLGQMTQLLKKLLDSTGNPSKRATLIAQDFKIWNLSLDIFKF